MEKQFLLAIIIMIVLIAVVGVVIVNGQDFLTKPFQMGIGLQTDCQTWATQKCASSKVPQSVKDSVGEVPNCDNTKCGDQGKYPCMCGKIKIEKKEQVCCYKENDYVKYDKKGDCNIDECSENPDSSNLIRTYMYNCWQSAGEGSVARRLLQTNCNFYP